MHISCIYMYDWVTLLYSRNWHHIVNQLFSNLKNTNYCTNCCEESKKKKIRQLTSFSCYLPVKILGKIIYPLCFLLWLLILPLTCLVASSPNHHQLPEAVDTALLLSQVTSAPVGEDAPPALKLSSSFLQLFISTLSLFCSPLQVWCSQECHSRPSSFLSN